MTFTQRRIIEVLLELGGEREACEIGKAIKLHGRGRSGGVSVSLISMVGRGYLKAKNRGDNELLYRPTPLGIAEAKREEAA